MVEGNETSGEEPGRRERDVLAERRAARRGELGDAALARRAEAAEATVRTLQTHLANLQERLRETEDEQLRAADQLSEREQEVRRVKQREYAEQQLRVEAEEQRELLERERRAEVGRLHRRLAAGERHARELADQLESVRRELAEVGQAAAAERAALRRAEREESEREAEHRVALAARLGVLEGQAAELRREMERERSARERAELALERIEEGYARLETIVAELRGAAAGLRGALDRERLDAQRELALQRERLQREHALELQALRAHAAELERRLEQAKREEPVAEEEARRRAEMAEALAAAVERLRARVAAVGELEPEGEPPPARERTAPTPAPPQADAPLAPAPSASASMQVDAPLAPAPSASASMQVDAPLAPAPPAPKPSTPSAPEPPPAPERTNVIPPTVLGPPPRRPWLARAIRDVAERRDAKLAAELVSELLPAQGSIARSPLTYVVRIAELDAPLSVSLDGERATVRRVSAPAERVDFQIEGSAAAFAELAAGGTRRRSPGLRVRGSRRRARHLRAARREPLTLADLVAADVRIWPGLLLLALAEAIDPAWTSGHNFALAFAIEGPPSTPLYVQVCGGEPLVISRERGEDPLAMVQLSELAFLCVFAGVPLPAGEEVLVSGPVEPLALLLGWTDRVQGLRRSDA